MTIWKALKTPQLGVVIYNYHGKGMYQLKLQLGETVQILEESSGWYRGFSLRNKGFKGIFPMTYIYVKDNKDEPSSEKEIFKEEALVEELTSVLREWGAMWKQVYLRREEVLFHDVKKLMLELMDWRRQILAKALPVDQLKQLKQKVTQTIDYGNRTLGLDLVVRDPESNIIDPDSTGVIELYRQHVSTSNRIKTTSRIETPKKEVAFYTAHSVYANIKLVVCNIQDDAQVFLSLYDAKEESFISEQYLVAWDKKGMPKDIDRLNNLTVLFTDLGAKDLKREQVYIVCQIVRVGRMDIKETDNKKLTHNLRRPFGIGLFFIGDLFNGTAQYDEDKEHFLQLLPIPENQSFDTWIKRMIAQQEGNKSGQGIHISLKLISGDVEQIREEHPLLVTKQTCIARKLGFPEVIMPGDLRNDLYLTIRSGEFERGKKTANKNIEVTMEVLSEDGTVLPNVISIGAGEDLVSEYRSVIFYHSGKPEWVETVKLVIPIEQFQGSHVRLMFKHRSANEEKDRTQKIFAFSHTRLMYNDGTTLYDGAHELYVYKNDHAGKVPQPSSYLHLPSKKDDILPVKTSNMPFTATNDKLRIDTLLCSTKLTQNVDLLGLLKWNSMVGKLKDILVSVMKVSGEEIVKFLTDTFDALFAILMQHANKYDKLVFDALVFTISLLADKKYHHFRPVLDAYIEELFGATKADHILISVFLEYISYATKEPQPDRIRMDLLLKAMKAMEYIFKFIVQSRILFERAVGDKGQSEFEESLRNLFQAQVQLMADVKNETLLTQGAALKYFPATFVDLMQVFDVKELSYYAREFIEKIPDKRLTSQKMDCIHNMVKTKLFEDQESRYVLLPMVVEQLKNKMSESEEMKICIDILNDILIILTRNDVGNTHDDVLLLVTSLLRVVVKAVIMMDRSLAVVGNYVACLIAMLQLMDEKHYQKYVAHFPTDQDLLDFLMELFLLFREFVSNNIFPKDWMVMTMVQNNVILNAIQYFSEAMQDHFGAGQTFEKQLWNNFFHLAVAFVTQESLQLENFSTTKQDKILEKYADMRMIIGLKISQMWHLLGDRKSDFIPGLVGPFLEMTLIPHSELRRATIPIFFDMIQCEYASKENFTSVESEIISKLDVLVEGGKGDAQYKDLFYKILSELFNPMPPQFKEDGIRFVGLITKLMERLLDYRTVVLGDDNIDNRMSCTVNVLNFYNEIKKDEMYDRYVYKLCDLHLSVENYTEAAFTLLRRADDLSWDDEPVFSSQDKYRASTQRQLKEMLYKDCIDYFDKGKCWEYAIKLCKDLASQYEYESFDFIQLSKILEKQAGFYDNIIKVVRGEPEYFKVAFYGLGFPTFLRNKVFVYRGKEYERIGEFVVRLQSQYPSAQILKMKDAITNDLKHSSQQYLQINKVDPVPVERRKFQRKNVLEQITKFYEVNNVNKFQFSRGVHKGQVDKDNEFSTLWLERTTIYTRFTFPGILCWFEATAIDTEELNPVQNALETMESTNKQLRAIIARFKVDPNLNINPLSMKLGGVIDAAVMGGVVNYEKAFLTPEFIKKNPDSADYVERLKDFLVEQVEILEEGMAVHGSRVSAALKPFHENLEKRFKEMKTKTAPFKKARVSTASKPRTPDGSPAFTGRSMTTVRRSSERPAMSVRDSLDKMHQSYSDWNEHPSGNLPPALPTKTLPVGVRSRANRRATTEVTMSQLREEFTTPIPPTSEIAPAKPPRPTPQALHSLPELPQKGSRKKSPSPDVQQRSSTESSGSDGTEPVEQTPALPPRTSTMAKPKDSPPVPPKGSGKPKPEDSRF